MYFGNSTVASGARPNDTWNTDYTGVWHLAGDATDSTTHLHNGTVEGAVGATGAVGQAMSFSGASTRIDLGSGLDVLTAAPGFTVSAWVKPQAPQTGIQSILGVSIFAGTGARTPLSRASLGTNSGGVTLYCNVTDAPPTTTVGLGYAAVANEWHLWTATVDFASSTTAFYVDGSAVSVPQRSFSASQTPSTPSSNGSIGSEDDGSSSFFQGAIDEVRISRTARSATWAAWEYATAQDQVLTYGVPLHVGP